MAISNAISQATITRALGYQFSQFKPDNVTTNLPQSIPVFAQISEAKDATAPTTPFEFTSAEQVAERFGYCPAYYIARILRPKSGTGVGSIPTIVYPLTKDAGAAAKALTITPSGTATNNGTHYLRVAGRTGIDGNFYAVNIETGDTATEIAPKIEDAINGVLQAPVSATETTGVTTATAKWAGLTSDEITIEVLTDDAPDIGISYAVASTVSGSGTSGDISDQLDNIGEQWRTLLINGEGTVTTVMDALQTFNGIPNPTTPTGRYSGNITKPLFALTGVNNNDSDDLIDNVIESDTRRGEVTIVTCNGNGSDCFTFEAAANVAALLSVQAQNNPAGDISGQFYPDLPVTATEPQKIHPFAERQKLASNGISTTKIVGGRIQVQDLVTTYRPAGDANPSYRWVRSLIQDWNIAYRVLLMKADKVQDKTILNDQDVSTNQSVVKPSMVRGYMFTIYDGLVDDAIIADAAFAQENTTVEINDSNPDRLDIRFKYKRSSVAHIASTTGVAGFNFGTN